MRRVNEAMKEVISNAITAGLKDPRIGFVTLTSVETSPDLRHATVYVSVFGNEEDRADSLAGLHDSRKLLQTEIAASLRLKNTPKLTFAYDDSVDRGMRMTKLLADVPESDGTKETEDADD